MNDVKSLLIATTVLAIGGLGLYMYKNSDESSFEDYDENNENEYNDDISVTEDDLSQDDIDAEIEEYYDDYDEPKPKARSKTKRSKKSGGTRKKH
jgi:hypothetical protein